MRLRCSVECSRINSSQLRFDFPTLRSARNEEEGLLYFWLSLVLLLAFLEVVAVSKNIQRLEYIAKPGVMVFLFLWLYARTGLQGNAFWFGLGILFSLAGDVFLMFPLNRFFLLGLIAFLFAHICYIIGFRDVLTFTYTWSWILLGIIAVNVSRVIRRIVGAMRAKGEDQLVLPVLMYGAVISVMLHAAMSTIYDPAWSNRATFFVGAGAILFAASDVILAWNRFVSPIKNGRIWNIALYYLGQIGLTAGVISQLG